MKKKKDILIFFAVVLTVCSAITVVLVLSSYSKKNESYSFETNDTESAEAVVNPERISKVESADNDASKEDDPMLENNMVIPEDAQIIQLDDNVVVPVDNSNANRPKAVENTGSVKIEAKTVMSLDNSPEPAVSESTETKKYSCGVAGHRCESPETHAFVCNLELDGCPYCGSHSCPSFYGVDRWGNGGLFPELCPKYNAANDAAKYCQTCGKPLGDGSMGTCVQFVNACNCPDCGEWAEAWTCHSHD